MLKLKEGFVLCNIAGENVVVPAADDLDLDMMITLNDTGCFLWKLLEQGAEEEKLVQEVLKEYDTDEANAARAVAGFIAKLKEQDFLA